MRCGKHESRMSNQVIIDLEPLGRRLHVEPGTAFRDFLFEQGVEFPCGGRGKCKSCRIKVLSGELPVTAGDQACLSQSELAGGWRLACHAVAASNLKIELAQWDNVILADHTAFAFEPKPGLGLAVDLGTTTMVAQLVDRQTGLVLGVRTALNPQARHGADVMSRIDFALQPGGLETLRDLARVQIGSMAESLLQAVGAPFEQLRLVTLVGNTVMHHLFCGLSVEPLAHHPFEPTEDGLRVFGPAELGWPLAAGTQIAFLPCLGSFVGSDILAGILATRMHLASDLNVLVDLGTNGELVVGNAERMVCTSTAAGPAFEGARIAMGMRAATGAISEVQWDGKQVRCTVLGQGSARGICGSGLVDAAAVGLGQGVILPSGRFRDRNPWLLDGQVTLNQGDIRELQLAKGAIAAGIRLLLQAWGATLEEVRSVYLAGAFGNYINRASARRIGMLLFPEEQIEPAGNTALLGAKMMLFNEFGDGSVVEDLRRRVRHLSLKEDPLFQDSYVAEMPFPG